MISPPLFLSSFLLFLPYAFPLSNQLLLHKAIPAHLDSTLQRKAIRYTLSLYIIITHTHRYINSICQELDILAHCCISKPNILQLFVLVPQLCHKDTNI